MTTDDVTKNDSNNKCVAGYPLPAYGACKVCGAGTNEVCGRSGEVIKSLEDALDAMLGAFEPFRAMPEGAQNSEARRRQGAQIAAWDAGKAALAKARGQS